MRESWGTERTDPLGQDNEDRQGRDGSSHNLEEVHGERVEPVAVLEHQDERLAGGPQCQVTQ